MRAVYGQGGMRGRVVRHKTCANFLSCNMRLVSYVTCNEERYPGVTDALEAIWTGSFKAVR